MPIENINLPVGRIVWGNPAVSQIKRNYTTKQPVLKDGKEIDEWACGIAIPKEEFTSKVWPFLHQEASKIYPNGVPRDFSWKYTDGDSVDEKGQPYNKREGYAGHYILKISTEAFAPSIFKFENGAYRQIAQDEIKCGDYVVPNVTIKAHSNNSGGLYINPNGFELVGYGSKIVSSYANPEEMFKRQQYQLPAGATLTPSSNAPVNAGMPQLPQQQSGIPSQPAGYVAQPLPTVAGGMLRVNTVSPSNPLPAPAYDFVQNAGVQQVPQQVAPAAYPAVNAAPGMPQSVAPMATGIVPGATTFPSNGIPGMPQVR